VFYFRMYLEMCHCFVLVYYPLLILTFPCDNLLTVTDNVLCDVANGEHVSCRLSKNSVKSVINSFPNNENLTQNTRNSDIVRSAKLRSKEICRELKDAVVLIKFLLNVRAFFYQPVRITSSVLWGGGDFSFTENCGNNACLR
jgi:hypothetical protein